MNISRPEELFVVYNPAQVIEAQERCKHGTTVICFDFSAGRMLMNEHVPHVSLRDIVDATTGAGKWWELSCGKSLRGLWANPGHVK